MKSKALMAIAAGLVVAPALAQTADERVAYCGGVALANSAIVEGEEKEICNPPPLADAETCRNIAGSINSC